MVEWQSRPMIRFISCTLYVDLYHRVKVATRVSVPCHLHAYILPILPEPYYSSLSRISLIALSSRPLDLDFSFALYIILALSFF